MGYINKDLILSGLNLRLIRLKSEHESEEKITELENIIGAIEETEIDDVIERSKVDKAIEESYKKGLTDAWECAREIGNNSQLGLEGMGFDFSELGIYYNPSWWVVLNYDVFKALEIIKMNIGE